jgi:hypothetical protein
MEEDEYESAKEEEVEVGGSQPPPPPAPGSEKVRDRSRSPRQRKPDLEEPEMPQPVPEQGKPQDLSREEKDNERSRTRDYGKKDSPEKEKEKERTPQKKEVSEERSRSRTREYPKKSDEEMEGSFTIEYSSEQGSRPLVDPMMFGLLPYKDPSEVESPVKSDVSAGSPTISIKDEGSLEKGETSKTATFDFEDLEKEEEKRTAEHKQTKGAAGSSTDHLKNRTEKEMPQPGRDYERPPGYEGINLPEIGEVSEELHDEIIENASLTGQDEIGLKEATNLSHALLVWKYKKRSPQHDLMQDKKETKREVGASEVRKYQNLFETAKKKEIASWKSAGAVPVTRYDPIKHGEPLPGRWVPTISKRDEKGDAVEVKERWTLRGALCPYRGRIDVDSPASGRTGQTMMVSWCARNGYVPSTLDVKTAFLRGKKISRVVATWPPAEAEEEEGMVWVLEVTCYGLAEAPKAWNERINKTLVTDCDMKKSIMELTLYYLFDPSKEGALDGMILVHVDDLLLAGNERFRMTVLVPLKAAYPFGDEKIGDFKFTGIQTQTTPRDCYS